MTENHSFGCIENQIAMGLYDFSKAEVYQESKELNEELKHEAEEKAKKRVKGFACQENCEKSYVMGALDFAEPREKRIEELEEELKITDESRYYYKEKYYESEDKVKELEKENAELKTFKEKCKFNVGDICKDIEAENNLTKSKELLKQWVSLCGFKVEKLSKDTEQFIRDSDIAEAIRQANEGLDFDKIADEMEQDLKDSEVEK